MVALLDWLLNIRIAVCDSLRQSIAAGGEISAPSAHE